MADAQPVKREPVFVPTGDPTAIFIFRRRDRRHHTDPRFAAFVPHQGATQCFAEPWMPAPPGYPPVSACARSLDGRRVDRSL